MIISIIGGGASGVSTLISLIHELQTAEINEFQINIFEPGILGEGLAYRVKSAIFLLNTSVGNTSIIGEDDLHFFKWLKDNENQWKHEYPEIKTYDEKSFLPRSLCKKYIQNVLDQKIKSSHNLLFKHIKEKVLDIKISDQDSNLLIHTKSKIYFSNYCILCTGYGDGISHSYKKLEEAKNYFSSLYFQIKQIKNIPKEKSILIIGSRLSAIDAALILKNHDKLTMASRTGYIPAVRKALIKNQSKYITPKWQKKFFDNRKIIPLEEIRYAIEKELSFYYESPHSFERNNFDKDSKIQLEKDIYLARRDLNYWQNAMMSIVYFLDEAWFHLTLHDKKLLLTNEVYLINRYISAFPLQTAEIIYEMMMKNKLLCKGHLKDIIPNESEFIAEFHENSHSHFIRYDYVINATSVDKSLHRDPNDLYSNLIKSKLIEINHFGGLMINNEFQIICDGKVNKLIYVVGPPTRGCILITNFLISCAKQAEIVSKNIKKNLNK